MSLNTLLEHGRTAAEYGRGLAERAPYSLVALVSRFAVASVFWRSGQLRCTDFTSAKRPSCCSAKSIRFPCYRPT
jgi:hypothetical protein